MSGRFICPRVGADAPRRSARVTSERTRCRSERRQWFLMQSATVEMMPSSRHSLVPLASYRVRMGLGHMTAHASAPRKMTPAARERFIDEVNDALSDPHQLMSEGRPHKKAKARALDMLGLHFKTLGRVIYLAEEIAMLYPGEESFSYDRARQRIAGYRLPEAGAKRYQPVLAQGGRYASIVLGLDLAIENNRLRFFHDTAELFDSANLIGRLSSMVDSLEAKAEQAMAKAE